MKRTRALAILMAVIQLLLLLSACGGEEAKTTEQPPAATTVAPTETPTTQGKGETPTTAPAPDEGEDPYLYIAIDGEAQYTIVVPNSQSPDAKAEMLEFVSSLESLTGASFRRESDLVPPSSEREILYCTTRHREDAKEALGKENSYTAFRMDVVGERIVLTNTSGSAGRLCDILLDSIYELEQGVWVCNREDLSLASDPVSSHKQIPRYDTEQGSLAGGRIYQSGYGGYSVCIERTNAEEFAAYVAKLESLGYSKYSENEIGLVDFSVYVKDDRAIYLQYNTSDLIKGPSTRITLTFGETQPATERPEFTPVVDAMVVNPIIQGLGEFGNGMHMYFQLGDGSFVIVDGAMYSQNDVDRLIGEIKQKTPEGQTPTISLWLWTHAHGDHLDMPKKAMRQIATAGIEVLGFGYNFPEWDMLDSSVGDGSIYAQQLVDLARVIYPDAFHWTMHAGQKMYIADAEIECLWSHENIAPDYLLGINASGVVFRVTVDDIDVLVLGDSEDFNTKMVSWYKEALRSHIVQNAHHTVNGPTQMYKAIDPIISLWMRSRSWGINGSGASAEHAQYLLNTEWTRTDADGNTVTGSRSHYSTDEYAVFYFKDLKASYGYLK